MSSHQGNPYPPDSAVHAAFPLNFGPSPEYLDMLRQDVGFDFPAPELVPNLHLKPFEEVLAILGKDEPTWPPAGRDPMAVTDAEALGSYVEQRLDAPGLEGVVWTEGELESLRVMMLDSAGYTEGNNGDYASLVSGQSDTSMGGGNVGSTVASVETPGVMPSTATSTTTATSHISNPPATLLPPTLESPSIVLTRPDSPPNNTLPPANPNPNPPAPPIRTYKPPSTTPLTFTYTGIQSKEPSPDLRPEYVYDRDALFRALRQEKESSPTTADPSLPSCPPEWSTIHKNLHQSLTTPLTTDTDASTSLASQWPTVCRHAISDLDFELLCGEVLNQALRAHMGMDYVRLWAWDEDKGQPVLKTFGDRMAWVKGRMLGDRRTLHLAMHSIWWLPEMESFGECRFFWDMTEHGPKRVPGSGGT